MSTELVAGSIYRYPVPIKAGETFTLPLSWRASDDGVLPETYVDMSLYSWRCAFKRHDQLSSSPAVTLTSSSGGGIVISGTGSKDLTLTLLPAQTAALTPGYWYHADIRGTLISAPTALVSFPLRRLMIQIEAPLTPAA